VLADRTGARSEIVASTTAMATAITVRAVVGNEQFNSTRATRAIDGSLEVFHSVEKACTRFDPESPLMRANSSSHQWHRVPTALFRALEEAYLAYERTSGIFDPRIIRDLVDLGYDHSLAFAGGSVVTARPRERPTARPKRWHPRFRDSTHEVRLEAPVDLGGIGKGLAVRWSSRQLAPVTPDYLVEAGGDCYCAGTAPGGEAWRVGIEDPSGGREPLAVLSLCDLAATTSSIKLRHWKAGDDAVHHLIDPRTGRSGGTDLVAVTVVGSDPAICEVDSKFLFLAGRDQIAERAQRHDVAALWVDSAGVVSANEQFRPHVQWQRS
jgi:thiamine biosynthesis lipoprotein